MGTPVYLIFSVVTTQAATRRPCAARAALNHGRINFVDHSSSCPICPQRDGCDLGNSKCSSAPTILSIPKGAGRFGEVSLDVCCSYSHERNYLKHRSMLDYSVWFMCLQGEGCDLGIPCAPCAELNPFSVTDRHLTFLFLVKRLGALWGASKLVLALKTLMILTSPILNLSLKGRNVLSVMNSLFSQGDGVSFCQGPASLRLSSLCNYSSLS